MKEVSRRLSIFEKYLTLWVFFCICAGIALGKLTPNLAKFLDG
ncbi:MAG: arsenical-resistance protein, partial [Candidatus Eisenbacteria bacterium]